MGTDRTDLTREECVQLTTDTISFCNRTIDGVQLEWTARTLVYAFLAARITQLLKAAVALLQTGDSVSIAIATLARAQLESASHLSFIASGESPEEREVLARRFVEYGEYRHVELIGNDRSDYLATRTEEERRNFERRVKVYEKVKREAGKEFVPNWNGLSIGRTIEATHGKNARKWWELMCHISHGSTDMFHKSVTRQDDGIYLHQADFGQKDAILWTYKMGKTAFAAFSVYSGQELGCSLTADDRELMNRLGLGSCGTEKDS